MKPACNPVFEVDRTARLKLDGELGRRLAAVTENWLLPAPAANPGMLEMFRDRDRRPARSLMPWAGEFAGKYLTHGVQILRLTRNPELKRHLAAFVRELVSLQDSDGYLGPWPQDAHLSNRVLFPEGGIEYTWDTWGHYHIMLGLLLWHETTRDRAALGCAGRIADLLCDKYLGTVSPSLAETGSSEMNLAPVHSLCLLYRRTGTARYLALARQIADKEFSARDASGKFLAGNYLEAALAGQPFSAQPKPRWESLHPIQGLAELFYLTGDARYRQAFEKLWWSMLEGDRHNNGGFTSGEQAQGNPYHWGAIETCCTVAWMAMSTDMLRLTGNSIVADELELSLFNSGFGLISPSGRWVTYDTPMDGKRFASAHAIVFQARESTPELNCCSVNGPRTLGLAGDWALLRQGSALVLNYYGPGTMQIKLAPGNILTLTQDTDYPREPGVKITVGLNHAAAFTLRLRIPHWSKVTRAALNGAPVTAVAGSYLDLARTWNPGDTLELVFDFHLRHWAQRPDFSPYRDWETEWQVFGPISTDAPTRQVKTDSLLATVTAAAALPVKLAAPDGVMLEAKAASSCQGHLNFDILCQRRPGFCAAYYFTEFESPADGILPVIFCADWWSWWYVNGQPVFGGESCAFDGDTSLRLFRIEIPVRRGKNLIGGKIVIPPFHSRPWRLSAGCAGAIADSANTATADRAMLTSIYRGPLLLTFDSRYNSMDVENIPVLDAATLKLARTAAPESFVTPWLLLEGHAGDGQDVRLCDFASAGSAGTAYRSWLPVRGVAVVPFSPDDPSRT